jgi:hypothetical protein
MAPQSNIVTPNNYMSKRVQQISNVQLFVNRDSFKVLCMRAIESLGHSQFEDDWISALILV